VWGGSRNRNADDLIGAEIMSRGDTSASSADVKGLGELNEVDARSIDTAEKHGYLEADSRRATALSRVDALAFAVNFDFQAPPGSTTALVRLCIFDARECVLARACK
jgi:hypothetical protein